MSIETIWVILWITGYAANIITAIHEGVPSDYPGSKAEHFFGVVVLSIFSWVLFFIRLFLKYKYKHRGE